MQGMDAPTRMAPRRAHSIKAAAKTLTISERLLRDLIAKGKVHAPKISQRRRIITDTELERLLTEGIE
jgi:predicted site-specific integrase-resolvase